MIWFTSDTHFGHTNVIKLAGRPFNSVEEMDAELVRRWNAVVKPNDEIYHLGDFSFYTTDRTNEILASLSGRKFLVKGNHDSRSNLKRMVGWEWIKDYYELKHQKRMTVLMHYPLRSWRNAHYGVWHLHGHSHGTCPPIGRMLDVGVDCWSYAPVSLETVSATFEGVEHVPQDHHI